VFCQQHPTFSSGTEWTPSESAAVPPIPAKWFRIIHSTLRLSSTSIEPSNAGIGFMCSPHGFIPGLKLAVDLCQLNACPDCIGHTPMRQGKVASSCFSINQPCCPKLHSPIDSPKPPNFVSAFSAYLCKSSFFMNCALRGTRRFARIRTRTPSALVSSR
jgi:hypothetical protein